MLKAIVIGLMLVLAGSTKEHTEYTVVTTFEINGETVVREKHWEEYSETAWEQVTKSWDDI